MKKDVIIPCGERISFSDIYRRDDVVAFQKMTALREMPEVDIALRWVRTAMKVEGTGSCTAVFNESGVLIGGGCLREAINNNLFPTAVQECSRRSSLVPFTR